MAGTASADIHTTLADERGQPHTATRRGSYAAILSLTALGIVYGVLSLIFWALVLIISIKYCVFVLRSDNRGEGGILALTALATPIKIVSRSERTWLVVLGIFGASLLYGGGIITPAISLLGAVWGGDYTEQGEYLRVFVGQLRKKIEPDPSNPLYILTEPWVGYRFDAESKR